MGVIADGNVINANDILGCMRTTIEAGEAIAVGKICYINLSDGKAYISDKDTQADYRADGIAYAGVSSGADVTLVTRGLWVTTGLTDKEVYYLGTTGALTTTQTAIKVGVANGTTELFIDIVQDDRDAVGTIKGVNLNLTGVPSLTAFWQLCDGTIISDAESPLNGQTIVDLNGNNRMLRAADTSNGTGGSNTHFHTMGNGDISVEVASGSGGGVDFVGGITGTVADSESANNVPAYQDVCMVIKIK